MVARPELIEAATRAHTLSCLATTAGVQIAFAAALDDRSAALELAGHRDAMAEKGRRMHRALSGIEGVATMRGPPDAGFYCFAEVSGLAQRLPPGPGGASAGEAVAGFLLRAAGVAVVPGHAFGNSVRDFIRLSFAGPVAQTDCALERIRRAVSRL